MNLQEGRPVLPSYVVCPNCRGELRPTAAPALECAFCGRQYGFEGGIARLMEGEPFHDEYDPDRAISEERMDTNTTNGYTLPAVRDFASKMGLDRPLQVLSVGCGVGSGTDLLNEHGFDCVGIDCGSRVEDWKQRKHKDKLYIANAKRLPFADNSFDMLFSGCMLAHIGVVGDSWVVQEDYQEQRSMVCAEMTRVLRPGGQMIISGANRSCPFDLFHRDHGYMPRFHSPSEKFLLSLEDYRKLFIGENACRKVEALPITGYWSFNNLRRTRLGRGAAMLIDGHMRVVSRVPALRSSLLNPWIIVRIEK
jgi:SAM-dependent methyltransferase